MKVLIFSASTGGGHKRAADALMDFIKTNSPQTEVKILDGIALTGSFYNNFVCGGYRILAKKAPHFYGHIYRVSDKKSMLNDFCNNVNKSMSKRILPAIEEYKPDIIVSCHAFVTTMLGDLKTKRKVDVPIISLITDFSPHYTYIADGIDHYVVSSEKMVKDLNKKYNIDKSRVHPFGIPVFQKFSGVFDKSLLIQKLNLKSGTKTILFMAGSFGVNEVLKVYKDIANKCRECQFAVITGNNPKLYSKFKKIVNKNTQLLMYVNNVEDYMHCADIIITKPGGLTVSESLQCTLPMAIYSAFPGQEADNADFLLESGVAIMLEKNPGDTINELVHNKDKLQKMSNNCLKICIKDTSQKILELMRSITQE